MKWLMKNLCYLFLGASLVYLNAGIFDIKVFSVIFMTTVLFNIREYFIKEELPK